MRACRRWSICPDFRVRPASGHPPILSDRRPSVADVTASPTTTAPAQTRIDDDQLLFATTFVVLDLETTGASPAADRITEIGAVKVCGGEVLGEFATLVDPGVSVPADVAGLTGLTDAVLVSAPPLAAVLPSLLEFVGGAVLVAHNAPFDVGFLHAGCTATDRTWPAGVVVDTVRLARAVLDREEVPDCRLATLAAFFRSPVTPDHRALPDARATVEVLHGLFERLGSLGVRTLGDLRAPLRAGDVRPAGAAPPRRRATTRSGRVHLPRRRGRGPAHGASRGPAPRGPSLFHRRRNADPGPGGGRPDGDRRRGVVPDRPRCPAV